MKLNSKKSYPVNLKISTITSSAAIIFLLSFLTIAVCAQTCPTECECLTEAKAAEKFGSYLKCTEKICGYYTPVAVTHAPKSIPKYCFKKTGTCPKGCECMTEVNAKKRGYVQCDSLENFCGYDRYKNKMYCYQEPAKFGKCPAGCVCLGMEEAKKQGYSDSYCLGKEIICSYDKYQNPLYCHNQT